MEASAAVVAIELCVGTSTRERPALRRRAVAALRTYACETVLAGAAPVAALAAVVRIRRKVRAKRTALVGNDTSPERRTRAAHAGAADLARRARVITRAAVL